MKTIPTIFTDLAGRGVRYAYLVDIEPAASDSWATKRIATYPVMIGEDAYTAGIISKISALKMKADMAAAGAADTADSLNIRLSPKASVGGATRTWLFNKFSTDRMQGRKVKVYLAAIPPNLIINASFEKKDSLDKPTDWTIVANYTDTFVYSLDEFAKYQSRACAMFTTSGATTHPKVTSNTFTVKRGAYFHLHWWQYSPGGLFTQRVRIRMWQFFYNFTTKQIQAYDAYKDFTNSVPDTWEKFSVDTGWHEWVSAGLFSSLNDNVTKEVPCEVSFEMVS